VGYCAHPYGARQGVILVLVAGLANCCGDSAGLTIRGSNPGRRKEFFSFAYDPDQLYGPQSLLFNGKFALSAAGVERPGRGVDWREWICMCTPQYAFVGVFVDAFTFTFTYVCIATFCPECTVSLIPRIATAHSLCVLIAVSACSVAPSTNPAPSPTSSRDLASNFRGENIVNYKRNWLYVTSSIQHDLV
jgi:hypothetical protein